MSAPPMQLDAFDAPVFATPTRKILGMVRRTDALEAQRAAVDTRPKVSAIQAMVLHALAESGPLTDRELEGRPEFRALGPSTVRKRRSELYAAGRVVKVGRRDGMATWDVAGAR